jgi:hypothetical protein
LKQAWEVFADYNGPKREISAKYGNDAIVKLEGAYNGTVTPYFLDMEGPFLSIETLREHFLKETKVDIYDTEKVIEVYHARHEGFGGKTYYDIFVRKEPGSHKLDAYLLDGVTGKILFKADAFRGRGIGPSAYIAYKEHLESTGRKP